MIDRRSPNHNYCKLVPNDTEDMESDFATTIGLMSKSSATFQNEAESDVSLTRDIENRIALLVGYEKPMSLAMLNGHDQKLVRPIKHDFIQHMGNNVDS